MEARMSSGKDLWDSADDFAGRGGVRSVNAMRFYALAKMVAEAESAWLTGDEAQAVEHTRQLQAHCQKMVAGLGPNAVGKPTLIASAA
jgi:hypothetical protein